MSTKSAELAACMRRTHRKAATVVRRVTRTRPTGRARVSVCRVSHARGLVDQLNFVINPVMAGSGTALFRPGRRTNLRLVSVTERRNGAVILSYVNA